LLSSWEEPRLSISPVCVEDDEELADAGGERLFGGFSGGSELLIVRGNDRVRAKRGAFDLPCHDPIPSSRA
jgi:hypothetical protein